MEFYFIFYLEQFSLGRFEKKIILKITRTFTFEIFPANCNLTDKLID
jgi:hypothetical protein